MLRSVPIIAHSHLPLGNILYQTNRFGEANIEITTFLDHAAVDDDSVGGPGPK